MEKVKLFRYTTFFLSVISHLLSLYFYYRRFVPQFRFTSWQVDFHILLFLSLFCTVLILVTQQKKWGLRWVLIRFFLLLVLGFPLGEYIWIEGILFFTLLLELGLFAAGKTYLFFAGALLLIFLGFQQGSWLAWGTSIKKANFEEILLTAFISLIIIIAVSIADYFKKRFIEQSTLGSKLNRTIRQLADINLGYQNYTSVVEAEATHEERKRITREIHDSVGYTLTTIMMMIEAALDLVPRERQNLIHLLNKTKDQAQEGLNETRRSLRLLRSVENEQYQGIAAIQRLVHNFIQVTKVHVECEFGNIPNSLGETRDKIIYRIIQEGITNSFRHGKATKIRLYLWQDDTGLKIYIHDNGIGSTEIKEGLGLSGMRERLKKVNGKVTINQVSDGFKLSIFIPKDHDHGKDH